MVHGGDGNDVAYGGTSNDTSNGENDDDRVYCHEGTMPALAMTLVI